MSFRVGNKRPLLLARIVASGAIVVTAVGIWWGMARSEDERASQTQRRACATTTYAPPGATLDNCYESSTMPHPVTTSTPTLQPPPLVQPLSQAETKTMAGVYSGLADYSPQAIDRFTTVLGTQYVIVSLDGTKLPVAVAEIRTAANYFDKLGAQHRAFHYNLSLSDGKMLPVTVQAEPSAVRPRYMVFHHQDAARLSPEFAGWMGNAYSRLGVSILKDMPGSTAISPDDQFSQLISTNELQVLTESANLALQLELTDSSIQLVEQYPAQVENIAHTTWDSGEPRLIVESMLQNIGPDSLGWYAAAAANDFSYWQASGLATERGNSITFGVPVIKDWLGPSDYDQLRTLLQQSKKGIGS